MQKGFLPHRNIPADRLAESPLVAIRVQQVVLNLERQPEIDPELIQRPPLRRRSAADNGPHLQRRRQQHRGLEPDHLHILRQRHLAPGLRLEIHVVLLPLAHLHRRPIKNPQQLDQPIRPAESLSPVLQDPVSEDQHRIARQNSSALAPLPMHRRPPAPKLGLVHNIVVQQREVMEHLHRHRGIQRPLRRAAIQVGPHQTQQRPNPFPAILQYIPDRGIQPARLHPVDGQLAQRPLHTIQQPVSILHLLLFYRSFSVTVP